jgi:hypothetical protein
LIIEAKADVRASSDAGVALQFSWPSLGS